MISSKVFSLRLAKYLLAALVVIGLAFSQSQVFADPGPLSGTVTDSANNAIENVLIEVLDQGTGNTVASDTTDVNGDYSIPILADATYNLRATPPVGSGFVVSNIPNVVVSGSTLRDIVLARPGVTLSGRVTDQGGSPVAGYFESGYFRGASTSPSPPTATVSTPSTPPQEPTSLITLGTSGALRRSSQALTGSSELAAST